MMKNRRGMMKALFAVMCGVMCAGLLSADSISSGWQDTGVNPAVLPGNPLDSYTWSGDSPFGSNPFDDPGFNLFTENGGFLFTANTYYHFTGTPEITLWSTNPGQTYNSSGNGGVQSQTLNANVGSATPEPAATWLFSGGFAGLAGFARYRSRRIRFACSSSSSGTPSCSARIDTAGIPSQS